MLIDVVQPGQKATRKSRMPNFPIQGGMRAQGLYPLAFTPVLPGETLKSYSQKMTVVSPATRSPLVGAWLETWAFYIRLTDIDRNLSDMFIGQLTDSAAYQAPEDRPHYFTKAGQIDWCKLATDKIAFHQFRDEDEAHRLIDTDIHEIKLIRSDFTESMIRVTAADEAPLPATQDELTPQMQAFMAMRHMGMSNMSYEKYLKTYGVNTVHVEEGEPELLDYRRYWTKPSNVLDPATGAPTGSYYWNVEHDTSKSNKPKLFREPGFVLFYAAVRPKVFDAGQISSAAASIWGFSDFMPSYTLGDPSAGIEKLSEAEMPYFPEASASEYYIDRRDLHYHGEQFRNGQSRLPVPEGDLRNFAGTVQDLRGQYLPAGVNIFADSVTETDRLFDYEGIITPHFVGHIQDNT